jgi:hypothetical protein
VILANPLAGLLTHVLELSNYNFGRLAYHPCKLRFKPAWRAWLSMAECDTIVYNISTSSAVEWQFIDSPLGFMMPKSKHNRSSLESKGVTFDVCYEVDQLPDHIARIRHVLLDFREMLPEKSTSIFEKDREMIQRRYPASMTNTKATKVNDKVSRSVLYSEAVPPESAYWRADEAWPRMKKPLGYIDDDQIQGSDLEEQVRKVDFLRRENESEWVGFLHSEIFVRPSTNHRLHTYVLICLK